MAIFEFTDTTYIEAVWFVGDGDTLGVHCRTSTVNS